MNNDIDFMKKTVDGKLLGVLNFNNMIPVDDIKEKKNYLLSVNKQHKDFLEMFKGKDRAGLRKYLEEKHWAVNLAVFES